MSGRSLPLITIVIVGILVAQPERNGDAQSPGVPPRTGRQLYEEACASCHGTDGQGVAVTTIGFSTPLPDFTNCSFASREPDEDWLAVIHDGGRARAFDRMMPAFRDALTAEEMSQILGHVRGFCDNDNWPRGELNLPRPLVTEKAYPEDEAVLFVTADAQASGSLNQKLIYERRFGTRNQVEVVVPFGLRERVAGGWIGGVGDIALSAKRAMFHSLNKGSIFSVAGEIILPTGDKEDGLGGGATIFEPFVAFGQILPFSAFLQFQAGLELPADRGRTDEAFWRTAVGKTFTQNRYGRVWSPMVEVLAARELVSAQKVQWDLVPQVQISLSTRQHVMLNAGVRIPMNDSSVRTKQIMFYLLWDWFDGGLFSGW